MAPLISKPGITSASTFSIPITWSASWFRNWLASQLVGADIRNALTKDGILITGNLTSPYATIGLTAGYGTAGYVYTSQGPNVNPIWAPAAVSGITVTDGTNTVSGATKVTFSGATVSGSTPNAIVTVSGGGGGSANITPDTHPATELPPNDEFEYGTTLDTTGARFAGATAWSWLNQGTATATVTEGSIILVPDASNANLRCAVQPAPSTPWTFVAKLGLQSFGANHNGGLVLYNSSNGKLITWGNLDSGFASFLYSAFATYNSTLVAATTTPGGLNAIAPDGTLRYFGITYNGTTLTLSFSPSGIPGTFHTAYSAAISATLAAITHIGLFATSNASALQPNLVCDWFRRTA